MAFSIIEAVGIETKQWYSLHHAPEHGRKFGPSQSPVSGDHRQNDSPVSSRNFDSKHKKYLAP
jgi:hypothetical protein